MNPHDRPYIYKITEQADGRFKVSLTWCGDVGTFEQCNTHRTLQGAIEHCQKRNPDVPFTVVWKKSGEDTAFEQALESIHGHHLCSTHRKIWDAGVEYGRRHTIV